MQNKLYVLFNTFSRIESMPPEQQDVFMGLCRSPVTDGDNTHMSEKLLFLLLRSQRQFNAEAISDYLNIKRKLRDAPLITIKHARALIAKLNYICGAFDSYGFIETNINPIESMYDLPDIDELNFD